MTVIDFERDEQKRAENRRVRQRKEETAIMSAEVYAEAFNELSGGKPFEEFSWIRLGNLYGVASVCYYKHDFSPISDSLFDSLCLYLVYNLEKALANRAGGLGEKKFLNAEMLSAGSGYDMKAFPTSIHDIAFYLESVIIRQRQGMMR